MPNHLHGIIELTHNENGGQPPVGVEYFRPIENGMRPIDGIQPIENDVKPPVGVEYFRPIENGMRPINGIQPIKNGIRPIDGMRPINCIQPIENDSTTNKGRRYSTPTLPNCKSGSIGAIVRGFKIGTTKQFGYSVWQRNYYEHIICDEQSYQRIVNYIIDNPANWKKDKHRGCTYDE